MAETELRRVIAMLQTCMRNHNKTAIIEVKSSAVLKVVKILEDRKFITTKDIKNYKYTVQVRKNTSDIYAVREETVKGKDILQFAKSVLPSITGIVVVSTFKGIMCHEEAHGKNIGGKVLLIAY